MVADLVLLGSSLVFGAMLGLAAGSFLNVIIHRVPRRESIVRPASHCPACGRTIRWWENIPLLSYLILRGRCRSCGARISLRYVFVEALGGLVAVLAVLRFGVSWQALAGSILGWHLVALALIDLDTHTVPDAIVLSLGLFGLPLAWLTGGWHGLLMGAVAAGILAGFFSLVRVVASRLLDQEAMGAGDITLVAAIGIYLHPLYVAMFLLLSSASMLIVVLAWAWVKKTTLRRVEIPFGPGLALGGWVTYMYGDVLMNGLLALVSTAA